MLVVRMVTGGMQVIDNIKCWIYSSYVRHNLIVGFLRHCPIRSLIYLTTVCCHPLSVHSINMAICAELPLVWRSDDGK